MENSAQTSQKVLYKSKDAIEILKTATMDGKSSSSNQHPLEAPRIPDPSAATISRRIAMTASLPAERQYQWIGLRENLQETMVFTIKYRDFL